MLRRVLIATCGRKPVRRLPKWGNREMSYGSQVPHPDGVERGLALGRSAGSGTRGTGTPAQGGQTVEPRGGEAS